ncbi:unnamed protein product [Rodentolepis nana]|uniref:Uncharacterized protein n=1 Tax=Rodentolepis nana TaxID=102285 RepID=A0A0R3TRM0_RODNA|nr:unnamed protein product [Rodentolepis nana]
MLTANPKPFRDGNFSKNGAGYLCEFFFPKFELKIL